MNYRIHIFSIILSIIILDGCIKEGKESGLNQKATLTTGGKLVVNVKTASALITKSGTLNDEINNLHLLIYNSANELVLSQNHLPSPSISAELPKGGYTVALLANYTLTDVSGLGTLDMLMESEAGSELLSGGKMVYAGIATVVLNSTEIELNITLKRVIAKVTFLFDKSALNPDTGLNITKIELVNVPGTVKLFGENRPGVTGINPAGDYITENLEPTSHESASPLYMFENLQGVSDNSEGASKKIPTINREACTYAQIWAEYSSPQRSGRVRYRLYLGENSVNDFNIFRETHYRENIRFTGNAISEISWRVDLSELADVKYRINVTAAPLEGGSVSGGGYYNYGEIPQLTASPSSGFIFAGWIPEVKATVSNMNYTANFTREVTNIKVTGISVNLSEIKLDLGENYIAQAQIVPENATNKRVIWSSSNEGVVTVNNSTGEIFTIGCGSSIITATSEDGGYTSSYTVEVFSPVNIEVKKHEIFEYEQITGKITNCVLILYSRVILTAPSDMSIVNMLYPEVEVTVNYSYYEKGSVKSGSTKLRLDNISNNDYPWNGVQGISEIFTFTTPATQDEIIETINSFSFTVTHSAKYIGSYHVRW